MQEKTVGAAETRFLRPRSAVCCSHTLYLGQGWRAKIVWVIPSRPRISVGHGSSVWSSSPKGFLGNESLAHGTSVILGTSDAYTHSFPLSTRWHSSSNQREPISTYWVWYLFQFKQSRGFPVLKSYISGFGRVYNTSPGKRSSTRCLS